MNTHKTHYNGIRLSICIPIYNFGSFIGDTLDSIIQQATDEVEIVIVDGGSTDNTQEVILDYQTRFSRINYLCLEKPGGIDADMAKTVELARGDYCWLFGGDDIMVQGAIEKALREIRSGYDLYLCDSIVCTFDMKQIQHRRRFKLDKEKIFNLSDYKDRSLYFRSANNTSAFFSFCGALIFNKDKWNNCNIYKEFGDSCWAHATRFFEMMQNDGLVVKYVPQITLKKRSDNDSFLDRGQVNRLSISIDGYHDIADRFFDHGSFEAFHIRRSLRNEITIRHIMNVKLGVSFTENSDVMRVLDRLVKKLYSDFSILNYLYIKTYQLMPMPLYRFIESNYKKLKENTLNR